MVYYPSLIDNDQTLPPFIDGQPVQASAIEKLRHAVLAIEKELGIKPSGTFTTVRARLDALENLLANLQIIELHQDLGGTHENPKVIGIQGRPVSNVAPQQGEVLVWNGIAWTPAPGPGAEVNFAGDLEGGPVSQTVIGINTIPVEQGDASNLGQYLRLTGGLGFQVGIHTDGQFIWLKDLNSPNLLKLNINTYETVSTIVLSATAINGLGNGVGFAITSDSTHVYCSIDGPLAGHFQGRVYVISKTTDQVVAVIEPTYPSESTYTYGIVVNGNDIFVASGLAASFTSTSTNQSVIDKYSKSQVLADGLGIPVNTLAAGAGEAFHGGMCLAFEEGAPKLIVTSYAANASIYKIDPITLTIQDSYTLGTDFALYDCIAVGSYIYVAGYNSNFDTRPAYKFIVDSINTGPVVEIDDVLGYYVAKDGDNNLWFSNFGQSALTKVDTQTDTVSGYVAAPDSRTFGRVTSSGDRVFAVEFASVGPPGSDVFSVDPDEWVQQILPLNLRLVYDDAGGVMSFQNEGSLVGTATTINAIGATFIQSEANVVDLVISGALPPPGNAFDHLRLIPGSIFANPKGLYYDSVANRLWVTNGDSNQVVKLDVTAGNPVVDTIITLPHGNKGWKIVGDDSYVYVTTQSDGYVFIIDKSTNQVVGAGFCGGGSSCTGITIQNIDGTNYIWVVGTDFGGGSVHQFNADLMLANYPSAQFPVLSALVPDGLIDWEDMCWVGGEGGYLVTGSAGRIYQFASENDGATTLFDDYGNNPSAPGYQLGSLVPVSYSGSYTLWTTALGSSQVQTFGAYTLDNGPFGVLPLGDFTGDIISDGLDAGNIWVSGTGGLLWRIDVADSNNPILIATITVPVLADSTPFIGMAYDSNNSLIWMADPGHNAIVSVSTISDTYVASFAGEISPAWAKGDVVFDSPFSKTNIVSTKTNQSPVTPGGIGQINFSETTTPEEYYTKGNYSAIFGGLDNRAHGEYNLVLGGFNNWIWDNGLPDNSPTSSSILGGSDNQIIGPGMWNVIAGGEGHTMNNGQASTIGGGHGNITNDGTATIAGGENNSCNSGGFVGGGVGNQSLNNYAVIGGGLQNHAYGTSSVVAGGQQNDATGNYSFVGGGTGNRAGLIIGDPISDYGFIPGGVSASTLRHAQMSHAGGTFNINFPGDAQFCRVVVRGMELGGGTITFLNDLAQNFALEDNKTYAMKATVIIHVPNGGGTERAMYVYYLMAHCLSGTATIDGSSMYYSNNAGGDTSSMSFSAVGNEIIAEAIGVANGSYGVLTYEWTEVGSH